MLFKPTFRFVGTGSDVVALGTVLIWVSTIPSRLLPYRVAQLDDIDEELTHGFVDGELMLDSCIVNQIDTTQQNL